VLGAAAQQSPPTSRFLGPKRMSLSGLFESENSLYSIGISNGYLVGFERPTPNVHLYSLANAGTSVTRFSLPDGATIVLQAATVDSDARILVTGAYLKRPSGELTTFVGKMDVGGRVLFKLDLADYGPSQICVAPDGSFWTLGESRSKESSGQDYDMLRSYRADGVFKQAYFSRRSLAQTAVALHPRDHPFGKGDTPAFLSCGDTSVGVLIGDPGSQLWVEVTVGNGVVQVWSVHSTADARILGVALLSQSTVFATIAPVSARADELLPLSRLSLMNDGSAIWTEAPRRPRNLYGRLVGADSGKLVVLRRSLKEPPLLFWDQP
jgi:hypothetical protein